MYLLAQRAKALAPRMRTPFDRGAQRIDTPGQGYEGRALSLTLLAARSAQVSLSAIGSRGRLSGLRALCLRVASGRGLASALRHKLTRVRREYEAGW